MYKYNYFVVDGCVKHCKKKVIFTWGFWWQTNQNAHCKKKTHQNMLPQLIKMNLQEESMVINVVDLSIE